MAQCVQSVQELVQDSFTPMVAVLCSEEAERVSRRNKLSFPELLRPFCRLTSEGHIRDPSNVLQPVKGLRISVNALCPSLKPPSSTLSPAQRQLLQQIVLTSQPQEGAVSSLSAGDYQLSFSGTTPWFEAYREAFLQTMPSSDHEFLNHYLACLLVVSSSESVPFEQFLKLSQEQHQIQHSGEYSAPKWFIPNTLKYYVLLHDVSQGDDHRAETVFEDMKQRYGSQGCYLLKINSRSEGPSDQEQIPDPWSQYLHKSYLLSPDGDSSSAGVTAEAPEQTDTGTESDSQKHSLDTGALPQLSDCSRRASDSTSGAPGGHGACLTLNDHDRIRQFIQEFTFRGLLPHVEKNIRQLNDQLVSRKGLSRSLFSATKKWFGGGKAPEKTVAEPKSTTGLLYPPEAPELQIRKMADLCFLVQHYELAYSCYHTAKKDFLSDQAMLYAAGALEMAAVSAFLQPGAPRPYPAHYMDTAIQTYKDTCRSMVLAERCTLLSVDILKSQAKYAEAATLLIKMTSEDSDLRSALLLEQAAHCFVNMKTPMVRKFAFHMILAGHRFSKASQRRHALRCYCQAMQVYQGRGWSLAEDHINFTIGRQSFTLQQADRAVEAFRVILEKESQQTASQQGAFLREYLYVFKSVLGGAGGLSELPLPCIDSSATRVYFGPERRPAEGEKQAATHVSLDQEYDQDSAAMWSQLELQLVCAANRGVAPLAFQPTQYCLHSQTDNLRRPLAVLLEPMVVEVVLKNPLKVALCLSQLTLLWTFTEDGADGLLSNEDNPTAQREDLMTNEVIADFPLGPEETRVARMKLVPLRTGQLSVVGLAYSLSAAGDSPEVGDLLLVQGRQQLKIQGPRLNQTKEEKMSVRHGRDERLNPIVTAPMPLLEVFFLNFPSALLCGEIRKAYIEFCNMSSVGLAGLRAVSTHPNFFTFGSSSSSPETPVTPHTAQHCSAYRTVLEQSQASQVLVSAQDFLQTSPVISIPMEGGVLQPGASMQLPLWLRGPDKEGVHEINFLFYYESTEKGGKISHRVLRHTVFICSSRSLSVQASACHTPHPGAVLSSTPPPPPQAPPSGTLVFLDVENINMSEAGVRDFHIVQVSSCGQRWCLQTCINPPNHKDWRLSSRERAKLCFRAVQCRPPPDAADKFTFADLNLSTERVVSSATPCGDFFFRCCEAQSQSPAGLSPGPELDLQLIVLWKAFVVEENKQLILEGQLHVALQNLGQKSSEPQTLDTADMMLLKFHSEPPPPPVAPRPELSELLRTHLHFPQSHSHCFSHSSLCVVSVSLTLTNLSLSTAQVSVELQQKSSSDLAEPCAVFSWVGKSQYRVVLSPDEVRSLPLRACFYSAGVYDLSSCRVLVRPVQSECPPESVRSHSPALIIINNA